MTTIFATTNDQVLTATILPSVASGNHNTVRLHVDFDAKWAGLTTSAVFYTSKDPTPYEVLFSADSNATVPAEVLAQAGRLFIYVKGVSSANAKVKSSTTLFLKVLPGTPSLVVSDPAASVYAQLLTAYGSAEQALAVERARINALLKLTDGSTTGDAELQDIRIGADGKTYDTAGEAVREQVNGLNEAVGFGALYRYTLEQSTTKDLTDVAAGKTYAFYIPTNDALKNVTFYVFNISGGYTTAGTVAPGKTKLITTTADTAYIRVHFNIFSAGAFSLFRYDVNEYALEPRVRELETHPVAWNCIVGATTGKIRIDSSSMTVACSGIFFLADGVYVNLATEQTLDLTAYTLLANGETVRIVLNASHQLEVRSINDPYMVGDVFLCLIYAYAGWNIAAARVYTNAETRKLIEFDGHELDTPTTNALTCKIFKRVCCCGDSFTSGHIADASGKAYPTNEEFAWPHYMATATGNEWINCGQSGANVLTWQTAGRGLPKAQEVGKVQAYIIGLMINDQTSGANGIELGTADDIGTDARTYYGGMSKIIRELNAISPKAKVFVLTCPQTSGLYPSYNQAVKDIVDAYKDTYPVHCLDLLANKDMYSAKSLTGDALAGHYTAIGYEQFAEILQVILSDYINTHVAEFQDVPFIEYDVAQ